MWYLYVRMYVDNCVSNTKFAFRHALMEMLRGCEIQS
jgi:hypothetical protein